MIHTYFIHCLKSDYPAVYIRKNAREVFSWSLDIVEVLISDRSFERVTQSFFFAKLSEIHLSYNCTPAIKHTQISLPFAVRQFEFKVSVTIIVKSSEIWKLLF